MRARLLLLGLLSLAAGAAPAAGAAAGDRDGDGLSDFDEVHKYRTDPGKADSDGDGLADGEAEERREFTYSIRCVVAHLPPAEAVVDLWQDARVLRRDAEAVELEITAYPFATPAPCEPLLEGEAGARAPGLAAHLVPNLTSDFDPALEADLRAALAKDGVALQAEPTPDEVHEIAAWALARVRMDATGFTIPYVTARDGRLAVEPGLERAFDDAKSDRARTLEEQFDAEARGRGMFRRGTCGSCTSAGVYLQTVLRALGVPTRTTVAMPAADGNDPAQVERLRQALRPSRLADAVVGQAASAKGWTEHTFNEVFVRGHWRRLNYARIDQPIADEHYLGLMLRILTYDDRATAGTAATWGRKHGLGLVSERFPTQNPYRLLAASDLLGPYARVPLLPPRRQGEPEGGLPGGPPRRHEALTIVGARWDEAPPHRGVRLLLLECREWFEEQDGDQYKRFTEQADLEFRLEADGRAPVPLRLGVGSFTGPGGHGVGAFVTPAEAEALVPGTPYRLVPRNQKPPWRWSVEPGVTVHREK